MFIDGSNFYHGAKRNSLTSRIDFHKFSMELAKGRNLIRTYYYTAPLHQNDDPEKYGKQQQFFQALQRSPCLMLKLGRLEKHGSTLVEKGVDASIAVDMLSMAYNNAIDAIYLVSADGDYVPAVLEVQKLGKKVFNVFFRKGSSFHLQQVCDGYVPITKAFIDTCKINNAKRTKKC